MKRAVDIVGSLVLILLLSPVFIITAVAIFYDGQAGPILFKSRRRGVLESEFDMLKFRSMVVNAERFEQFMAPLNEATGQLFKVRNDPRITPVGRIIRRLSIDELPQLFNVLKGEMSLVGPRPLPLKQFDRNDTRQIARLLVRPGITGLWQIRGRSEVSFETMLRLDLFYIERQSIALDFWILFKTIPAVLKGRGAY